MKLWFREEIMHQAHPQVRVRNGKGANSEDKNENVEEMGKTTWPGKSWGQHLDRATLALTIHIKMQNATSIPRLYMLP
jgi:hypothetical protein